MPHLLNKKYVSFFLREPAEAQGDKFSRLPYSFPNHTNFKVIHFGGGTPSQLRPTEIASILDNILVSYGVSVEDLSTVGIEIRPGDFCLDDFRFLYDIGFNRISLGVQSFDPAVLAGMGRKGSVDRIYCTYGLIRKAGFEDVNIDLLYGFPFQTFDQWKKDIDAAIALQPDHIDAHPWYFVDGRGWSEKVKANDQKEKAKKIRWTQYLRQRLTENGYSDYNHRLYCSQGKENLMHLVGATYSLPFLAFGAGAEHYRQGFPDEPLAYGPNRFPKIARSRAILGWISVAKGMQCLSIRKHFR